MADAYTRIFHELLEPLIQLDRPGLQFRILLWVARNSYGRGGEHFAPFSWRRIAKNIKADRRGVARAGAALRRDGLLKLNEAGEIGICKDGIRSLALGQPSQGDNRPRGQDGTKEGTTVPGYSYKKEKRNLPPASAEAEQLTNTLEALLKANGVRKMPNRDAGLAEADRLIRIDKRPLAEADTVLRFALADSFWKSNILSISKFREKYDRLRLRMEGANAKPSPSSPPGVSTDAIRANTAAILARRQTGVTQ